MLERVFRRKGKVIIVPDDHARWKNIGIQTRALQSHKPDILLHEALNRGEKITADTEELIQKIERFEENVRRVHEKIGQKFIPIQRIEDLQGDKRENIKIDRVLRKIKIFQDQFRTELRNLERMRAEGGIKKKWAEQKYSERLELYKRLNEIQEVLSALKDPETAGKTKFAQLVSTARKMGILVDGLEPRTAVIEHVEALRRGMAKER